MWLLRRDFGEAEEETDQFGLTIGVGFAQDAFEHEAGGARGDVQ